MIGLPSVAAVQSTLTTEVCCVKADQAGILHFIIQGSFSSSYRDPLFHHAEILRFVIQLLSTQYRKRRRFPSLPEIFRQFVNTERKSLVPVVLLCFFGLPNVCWFYAVKCCCLYVFCSVCVCQ